jgi:RNA polymerase sigma-70 factor (ECF subfamily)
MTGLEIGKTASTLESSMDTCSRQRSGKAAARSRNPARGTTVGDETELFAKWCAGDTRAGDALARRFHQTTRAYFARRFPSEAEDLAQRTWIAIAEARARFRGASGFAGFFAGVARNICREEIRRRYRTQFLRESLSTTAVRSCDPTHEMELAEDVQRLTQALQQLPSGLFDTVHLYYFECTSARLVGDGLGVPEANVRSRLHRARALLRNELNPAPPAPRRATVSGRAMRQACPHTRGAYLPPVAIAARFNDANASPVGHVVRAEPIETATDLFAPGRLAALTASARRSRRARG